MSRKLKVSKYDIIGASIYDLAFIIQTKLLETVDYRIVREFQRKIFKCKNSLEMLTIICSYVVVE